MMGRIEDISLLTDPYVPVKSKTDNSARLFLPNETDAIVVKNVVIDGNGGTIRRR